MIKTVAFDIGNVLIFFSYPKLLTQVAECIGLSPDRVYQLLIENKLRELYEKGAISSDLLYKQIASATTKHFTKEQFFHALSNIFTPNLALFPLVEALKKKNIRLLLLSNTSEAHVNYLKRHYPIFNLFDAAILSHEVKAPKPAPEIYKAALLAANCAPSECFYTDDIPDYIHAARSHGIDAELFTDVPTLEAHLSLRNLL